MRRLHHRSNAELLSGELATLLTGRYIETEVLPFSYAEYIEFLSMNPQRPGGHDIGGDPKFLKLRKKESFRNLVKGDALSPGMVMGERLFDFLYNGGIPLAVAFGDSEQELSRDFLDALLDSIVEKDIFKRHEVYSKASFNKLIDFLMDSIGPPVSPNSIANVFRSENTPIDNKTVSQYLGYLTESYLFYEVPRYDLKGKGLLRTLDKYYLSDTGFRKVRLSKDRDADAGCMLENAVYLELRRRCKDVYVGKWDEYEVDFVAVGRDMGITYYQVAFSTTDPKTLERELRPLRAIRDSNPKFLLTTDVDFDPVYDGIRKLNVVDWLHQGSPKRASAQVNDTEASVLSYVGENPQARVSDIAEGIGASRSSVERAISRLKAIGLLSRTGNNRVGMWVVERD